MSVLEPFTSYKGLDIVPVNRGSDTGTTALTENFVTLADRAPFESASNPTTSDDTTDGFAPGDLWLNTSTATMWTCVSATAGAAVWKSFYHRTLTALELIPQETSEQVVVAGQLKVTGKDSGGTALLVSSTGAIAKLENTAGSMQLFIDAKVMTTESASFQLRNIDSPGNDRTLFSRVFSSHGTPDRFNILHFVGGTQVCSVSITNTGGFVVTPNSNVTFAGGNMGNLGIGTTAPKTKLHATGSTIIGANTTEIDNADLSNGEVYIWLDETGNLLKFKAKYSNGTVKRGSVALT